VCVILNELLFSESLSELRILEIKYRFYDIVFLYFTQFILRSFILDIGLRRPRSRAITVISKTQMLVPHLKTPIVPIYL